VTTLTGRELEVLRRLASFRYLYSAQIQALLFDGSRVGLASRQTLARRLIRALWRRGLIGARPRLVGGLGGGSARRVYFLTDSGRRVLATAIGASSTQLAARGTLFMEHALAIADVALAFRRSALLVPGHAFISWESDWELAGTLGPSPIRPDGRLVYATASCELEAFIELDLDTERPAAFAKKIARYLDCYRSGLWRERLPIWPTVLTVTPTVVRATSLRRTTEMALSAASDGAGLSRVTEFRFASAPQVHGDGGPTGAIWQIAGRLGFHSLLDADDAPSESSDSVRADSPPVEVIKTSGIRN